ncbi:LacI family DNA-binding transcriptional regulator [Streptomyces sp. NPDC002677]|uniref:LacI family DNA-binding transcriptional regulator n=1 Tax=Streptomyces sp. NPDC002677 TaxID=3154774 RepID=UPI003325F2F1
MNIGEIAKRAGVSRSTVSYVLSGKRPVSEEVRARVERVIKESGYRPSATARALAQGSTKAFGLVIPPMGGHLSIDQLHFVGSVAEAAADHDYDVLLSPSGREEAFDRMLGERRVDGVIVMETVLHDARVVRLLEQSMPCVTIGRTGSDAEHGWVDLDYAGLVTTAVERLAELGHRRIALVNRPQALLDREYGPAYRALDAFEKTVVELGLRGRAVCCEDEQSAGQECARTLLAEDPSLTALVTINERSLEGVLRGLGQAGLRLPEDFSLVAVTSQDNACGLSPQVTAADVPTAEMGRRAVEALHKAVTGPATSFDHVLLRPDLVERGTLGPAPGPGSPHPR